MDDIEVLAKTLWGEARGEGPRGMHAVANVIMNRVNMDIGNDGKPDWWGEGIGGVCLKPGQFSCWNKSDPNEPKLRKGNAPNDRAYQQALGLAELARMGVLQDITGGATHYHTTKAPRGLQYSWPPRWAKSMITTAVIGAHTFLKERT